MKILWTNARSLILLVCLALFLAGSVNVALAREDGSRIDDLCQRLPSWFQPPTCALDPPAPPPPAPSDACPNVPGLQLTTPCADEQCVEQGGTWNGTSCDMPPPPPDSRDARRDECARYASGSRNPVPPNCDACPNVPGWQTAEDGLCADKFCAIHGGAWTGTTCIFPPLENNTTLCSDGQDNDGDTHVDFEDSDCVHFKPSIKVVKIVINDNGGTASTSDFSLFVASESTGSISLVSGVPTTLPHAGEWIIGEGTYPGYQLKGFGIDCVDESLMVVAGAQYTCTITNDDVPAAGGGAGGGGGGI